MFQLWLRNDGTVNPDVLICKKGDKASIGNFFPAVAVDQQTVVFGGEFNRVERAIEAVRETSAKGYSQRIVFGTGLEEWSNG